MAERFIGSYSAPIFDTPDGALGNDHYAAAGRNRLGQQLYWIRIPDAQRQGGSDMVATADARAIQGKTLAAILPGERYVFEFREDDGRQFREVVTKETFDRVRTTPNEKPVRTR